MKNTSKLILVSTALLATTITPVTTQAEEVVSYEKVITEDYIKGHIGKTYNPVNIDKYVGGLKTHFEGKDNLNVADVNLVLDVVDSYINIGLNSNEYINSTSNDEYITNDVALVNYINKTIQNLKNKTNKKLDIIDQTRANEKTVQGFKIGDKTIHFNTAVRRGLEYVEDVSSSKAKDFENALSDIEDTTVRFELKHAIDELKNNKIESTSDIVFGDVIKSSLSDYKAEYNSIYDTYFKITEDTITDKNANDFVKTINYLIGATSDTKPETVGELKSSLDKLPTSKFKTLVDTTTLGLESFLVITASDAYNTSKIDDLIKIVTSLDAIQSAHDSTIQYDLLKTKTLINKINEAYNSITSDKTELQSEINMLINASNTLHNTLKDFSMSLLNVYDESEANTETNIIDITDKPVDNTQTVKGYESSARTDLYNPFNDIGSVYSKDEILELFHNGKIMKGKTDEKFDARSEVTRAHFAVIIARATGENTETSKNAPKDVKGKWYENHVQLMINNKIMNVGNISSDNRLSEDIKSKTFYPDAGLQRKDMALYLVRMLEMVGYDVNGLSTSSNLKDVDDNITLTEEEKNAIRVLEALDIIHGKPDKTFSPYETANRAQVAKVVYKTLELTGHI